MESQPALRRRISLPLLVLYGLGTTVGAGIYALIGEIAGAAGAHSPFSFLIAGTIAGLTGLTFAELSARFPKSAGEAIYVREGFRIRGAPVAVGLLVALAGTVSAATIANGFVGYLGEFLRVPHALAVLGLVFLLVGIAIWGIGESARIAGFITLVEIAGLLIVVWAARGTLESATIDLFVEPPVWSGVFGGSLIAFYAFLGFEDMVNVAEEVEDAPRALPRAILWTLGLSLGLYALVATAAIGAVSPAELANSEAPLVHIWEQSSGRDGAIIAWISIAAMVNGALIQIIMASRVLYGLSTQGWLPPVFSRVSRRTGTPAIATLGVGAVVLVLAVGFPLGPLAKATSMITLLIFAIVNAALWRIKAAPAPSDIRTVPRAIPALGLVSALGLLIFEIARRLS